MAGQKKKNLRYSEETPWFPEYYIDWIGIGNCGQKTSIMLVGYLLRPHSVWIAVVNRGLDVTLDFLKEQLTLILLCFTIV